MTDRTCPEAGIEAGLRFACLLDGRGSATHMTWANVWDWEPADGLLWVHLERDDPAAQEWVRVDSGLDPLVAEALLAEDTRPRVETIGDGLLIVLRGVSKNADCDISHSDSDVAFVPLHIWADGKRVISLRDKGHQLRALREIRTAAARGQGPCRPGEVLAQIAYRVVIDIEPVLDSMDDKIDALEEMVLEEAETPQEDSSETQMRRSLSKLRRRAIHLRRYLAPQRDAITRLQREECSWLTSRDRILLREDLDRLLRFIEYLDAIRDRAILLHDDLCALVSERIARSSLHISRTSNRMTALAALLLPPSLAAGLLGMNVGGIPWNTDPQGFLYMMFISVICSMVVFILLRIKKWV
ncbi:MAG: CorA family divalent cation transporter [Rhodospirillaceae bacterium]